MPIHSSCCVLNCKNTGRNSNFKFYSFPTASWKLEKRQKWINAVKRTNSDGTPWIPKRCDYIFSDHFVGGKKSEEELNPSYIPTIFPSIYKNKNINETAALNRHKRFIKRRKLQQETKTTTISDKLPTEVENTSDSIPLTQDKECQADLLYNSNESEKTFICNRYMYMNDKKCDVEIQTDIFQIKESKVMFSKKQYRNKECGTPVKILVDQSTQSEDKCFSGFKSFKKDEHLLAGTNFNNFNFLLKRTNLSSKYIISKEDRLLIFLMKIKTGLTFSALRVLFAVHRTTISRIFHSTLEVLTKATANSVFWPERAVVQATMPKCFYPDFTNTRVTIDCTEFRIEIPASVDNRVYCYSHYKRAFTAKVLIGITPGGFICLKSKVAGGRKTDSQLTIESGLINKLEEGDVVLADKGFPGIKSTIDHTGKQIMLIMPPFLEKNKEFTQQQTQETYDVARIRIHVERMMQRLRVHAILDKILENLFHCIDDILHICCVLVNLQPPITSNQNINEERE